MAESHRANEEVVIGIDLGTTFSCVGAWIDSKVKILTDEKGRRTLPSYVSFTENGPVFGWEAKERAVEDPKNTVFDVKRLIGRKFDEPSVQSDLECFGFEVVCLDEGKIGIQVENEGFTQIYKPEDISAMVLKHIKELAERQVGPVSRAVITVPAYFNDAQRSATKKAGRDAGLQVLRILNEPTAAAVAYGLNKQDERNVLIFDLGGGTFDVSLLTIDDGIFEVKATSGDTHLGGEDFDTLLANYCVSEFTKKCKIDEEDIINDPIAMRSLRTESEKCKIGLSSSESAIIEINNFFDGHDLRVEFSRSQFDEMLKELYDKMKEPVECVLRESNGMQKEEVSEVVLVGGSTRIPGVQQLLRSYFGREDLCNSIDPDEAVATGAAIQAAIIVDADPIFKDILLVDVLPLSLGIAVGGKQMDVLMPKNSPIPRSAKEIYTTYFDYQEVVRIEIYEGERVRVKDNHLLGAFELEVEKQLAGVPQVEVTFVINADGILQVTGQNINTGARRQITVRNQNHTDEDILDAYEEEELHRKEDEEALRSFEAKEGLREYTINIKNQEHFSKDVKREATRVLNWLEQNENCNYDLYESKQQCLEKIVGEGGEA